MEGVVSGRDVPYTTPEQQEVADFTDRLWEKADVEFHRLFGLEVLEIIKDTDNGIPKQPREKEATYIR